MVLTSRVNLQKKKNGQNQISRCSRVFVRVVVAGPTRRETWRARRRQRRRCMIILCHCRAMFDANVVLTSATTRARRMCNRLAARRIYYRFFNIRLNWDWISRNNTRYCTVGIFFIILLSFLFFFHFSITRLDYRPPVFAYLLQYVLGLYRFFYPTLA